MDDSSVDSSEVSDFKEILSMTLSGQLPLSVGGHAVNLWAIVFRQRVGRGLDKWIPLTSKDLDLVGMIDLLDCMKKNFGGDVRLSGPRSPVFGQLVANLHGVDRKIDASPDALKCSSVHGIEFDSVWPRELLTAAKDPRIQNFVKHRLPS